MKLYDETPAGRAALEKYRANHRVKGAPVLLLCVALLGGTAYFAWGLNAKRAFPWQHGIKLSDALPKGGPREVTR